MKEDWWLKNHPPSMNTDMEMSYQRYSGSTISTVYIDPHGFILNKIKGDRSRTFLRRLCVGVCMEQGGKKIVIGLVWGPRILPKLRGHELDVG
jgi:hypothetical protein